MNFDTDTWQYCPKLKDIVTDIREGRAADTHGWMFKV
jgi:branched-chain amino acid aminotransferase